MISRKRYKKTYEETKEILKDRIDENFEKVKSLKNDIKIIERKNADLIIQNTLCKNQLQLNDVYIQEIFKNTIMLFPLFTEKVLTLIKEKKYKEAGELISSVGITEMWSGATQKKIRLTAPTKENRENIIKELKCLAEKLKTAEKIAFEKQRVVKDKTITKLCAATDLNFRDFVLHLKQIYEILDMKLLNAIFLKDYFDEQFTKEETLKFLLGDNFRSLTKVEI